MVARFERRKRHDLLVQALASASVPRDFRLVLVGESFGSGECERAVDELLDRTGMRTRSIRLGFQQSIADIQQAADICVLCSDEEPLGQSVLEAMAMGIPVIVSEDGGLKELVQRESRQAGLVVAKDDVGALKSALETLARDDNLRALLGANGRLTCLEKCSIEVCSGAVHALYSRLDDAMRSPR